MMNEMFIRFLLYSPMTVAAFL